MTSQFNMNWSSAHQFDWLVLLQLVAKSRTQRTNTNKVIVDWPKKPTFLSHIRGVVWPHRGSEHLSKLLRIEEVINFEYKLSMSPVQLKEWFRMTYGSMMYL